MSGLLCLVFKHNNLMGNIPPEIGKIKQLQGLYLQNNKLKGHIPEFYLSLCKMNGFIYLNLSPNSIEGEVPQDIGELNAIVGLDLSGILLEPLQDEWSYLSKSVSRSYRGRSSTGYWRLNAIVGLDLSGNHFSGILLSKLGDIQNLKSHDLSNNLLSGPISLSFANLIILEILDLYINTLSGTIPRSLEKLLYLKAINVLFNNLEGEIPNGGVFANFTQQSFLGNRGLCGVHLLEVPSSTNPEQQSKSKGIVVKIVTLLVISSFMILLLVPESRTHQLVFYHEIQRETNYFDETNVIGVRSLGSVYKGIVSSGSVVAIKVLDLKSEEVYKRFDTECEVMRNVRHRNLVLVITTCSSDCIRAFVLQHMSNERLENRLYTEDFHLNFLREPL
ncbi:hypothetical protein P3S67_028435 [Capsicum chacoense]